MAVKVRGEEFRAATLLTFATFTRAAAPALSTFIAATEIALPHHASSLLARTRPMPFGGEVGPPDLLKDDDFGSALPTK